MLRITILIMIFIATNSSLAVEKPFFMYGGALTQEYKIDNDKLIAHTNNLSGMESDLDSIDEFNITFGVGYSVHPNINITLDRTTDLSFDNRSLLFNDNKSNLDLILTQVGVEGYFPMTKRLHLSAKLGRALISQEYDIESDTQSFEQSRTSNEHFYDLGVHFSINKHFSVKVGYQKIDFFDLKKQYANIIWYM